MSNGNEQKDSDVFLWLLAVVIFLFLAVSLNAHADEPVLILHKGDPFPPAGCLYSYDNKETEADFDRRRKMIEDIQKKGLAPHEILCRT